MLMLCIYLACALLTIQEEIGKFGWRLEIGGAKASDGELLSLGGGMVLVKG
jgi:hypothetical protein